MVVPPSWAIEELLAGNGAVAILLFALIMLAALALVWLWRLPDRQRRRDSGTG